MAAATVAASYGERCLTPRLDPQTLAGLGPGWLGVGPREDGDAPRSGGGGGTESSDSVKIVTVATERCTKTILSSTPWRFSCSSSKINTDPSPPSRAATPLFVMSNSSTSGRRSGGWRRVQFCEGLTSPDLPPAEETYTSETDVTYPRRLRAPLPGSSGEALTRPCEGFSVCPQQPP